MVERASDAQQHLLTGEAARNGVARDNVRALDTARTLGGGFEERFDREPRVLGQRASIVRVALIKRLI